jgi:hypothetical protein
MGNFQSVTDLTRLMQDVQYTTALRGMTPQQKKNYFNAQKQKYVNSLLDEREGTFQKVHTDATRNNAIQGSLFFYQQRNRDLKDVGESLIDKNEAAIGSTRYNSQLALRQYEINEWASNNKRDTLFVFQIVFITVLLAAALTYLQRAGFISASLLGLLTGIIIFVDIVVILNRSSYTAKTRDKRYWNRRAFGTKKLPVVPGALCPGAEGFEGEHDEAPETTKKHSEEDFEDVVDEFEGDAGVIME